MFLYQHSWPGSAPVLAEIVISFPAAFGVIGQDFALRTCSGLTERACVYIYTKG